MESIFADIPAPLLALLAFNVLNAIGLSLAFVKLPLLRRSTLARVATLLYSSASVGLLLYEFSTRLGDDPRAPALVAVAIATYAPLIAFILSASVQMLVELLLLRIRRPAEEDALLERFRSVLRHVFRSGGERLIERKLTELSRAPTQPQLHRELMELYLARDEIGPALYHAYSLVETLQAGHAHALALFRLSQILVERVNRLDAAQPHLRRIIRLYPRSYFASYARRLVNQYEAYADREA